MLQRTDESVRCVSVSQWVETISVRHSLGLGSRKHWRAAAALFLAQAKTNTESDSRPASLIQLAFLVDTNNYGWTHPVWSRSDLAN